jgi:hypothetical protein
VKESISNRDDEKGVAADRMKIAWRYERLGEFGRGGRSWVFLLRIANNKTCLSWLIPMLALR